VDSSGWFGIGLEVETFHLDPFLLGILYNTYFWVYEKFNQLVEELSLVIIVRVGYSLFGGYFEGLRLL